MLSEKIKYSLFFPLLIRLQSSAPKLSTSDTFKLFLIDINKKSLNETASQIKNESYSLVADITKESDLRKKNYPRKIVCYG